MYIYVCVCMGTYVHIQFKYPNLPYLIVYQHKLGKRNPEGVHEGAKGDGQSLGLWGCISSGLRGACGLGFRVWGFEGLGIL